MFVGEHDMDNLWMCIMTPNEGSEKDPRRCADIEYFSMFGTGVNCICGHFWWDYGPLDESGETTSAMYTNLACTSSGSLDRITRGVINHTAKRGCCRWKPCFDEERP